jgi:hypothetical protein
MSDQQTFRMLWVMITMSGLKLCTTALLFVIVHTVPDPVLLLGVCLAGQV